MVDSEGAFQCASQACVLRFGQSEEHLCVNKRQDMSLTIETGGGSKTPVFVADETPTPTRFIRNCEEVGLFQDLQNVNPFDEQFKRAAESATLTAPAHVSYTDDALHTPHVFPLPTDVETTLPPQFPAPKSGSVRRSYLMPSLSTTECLIPQSPFPYSSTNPSIVISAPQDEPQESAQEAVRSTQTKGACSTTSSGRKRGRKPSSKTTTKSPMIAPGVNIMPRPNPVAAPVAPAVDPLQLLLRLPDGRLVQIPAIPVTNNESPPAAARMPGTTKATLPKPTLSEAKMKLKQVLTKCNSKTISNTQPASVASPAMPSDTSGTDTDQGACANNQPMEVDLCRASNYQSASDPDEDEGEKRKKFLERNRAAAFRSRQKRKRWVSSLEAKTAALNNSNKTLQNEVASLRAEIARLKLQLLAHKDCPVTLAMCQAGTMEKTPTQIEEEHPRTMASATQAACRQVIFLNGNSLSAKLPIPVNNQAIADAMMQQQVPGQNVLSPKLSGR